MNKHCDYPELCYFCGYKSAMTLVEAMEKISTLEFDLICGIASSENVLKRIWSNEACYRLIQETATEQELIAKIEECLQVEFDKNYEHPKAMAMTALSCLLKTKFPNSSFDFGQVKQHCLWLRHMVDFKERE